MNIALLTSGGDSSGMNAALRSVTRSALAQGHQVFGVREGFQGLIDSKFQVLNLRSMANIIHQGGTILKSSRCTSFRTVEGRLEAYQNLKRKDIDILIGLGGNGTIAGLQVFENEHPITCFGLPCTIDNDCSFSEKSIGFDTALNTAVEAIDRVRDTASSHQRTFVIEVMGRNSPELAQSVAVAAGAEFVVDLKQKDSLSHCIEAVRKSLNKGKRSSLIVVLESPEQELSAAQEVSTGITSELDVDCRSLVLGHLQRGGRPTAADRILASEMGFNLVKNISSSEEEGGVSVCLQGKIAFKKFSELKNIKAQRKDFDRLIEVLSL